MLTLLGLTVGGRLCWRRVRLRCRFRRCRLLCTLIRCFGLPFRGLCLMVRGCRLLRSRLYRLLYVPCLDFCHSSKRCFFRGPFPSSWVRLVPFRRVRLRWERPWARRWMLWLGLGLLRL